MRVTVRRCLAVMLVLIAVCGLAAAGLALLAKWWSPYRIESHERFEGPQNGMCVVVDRIDWAHDETMRVRLVAGGREQVLLDWGAAFVTTVSWPDTRTLRISGLLDAPEFVQTDVPGLDIQYDLRRAGVGR